ncbi:MAG: hypothetical protein FH758_07920 [Firmicutes bacterium]|nr:hypothetical protein [Bacillota bacterium]
MLLKQIVQIGKSIVSSTMSMEERIQLLTDVNNEQTKNFYNNVFMVEVDAKKGVDLQFFSLQSGDGKVDLAKATAIPITLPAGGNPLHAQGVYPIPCYPLYERHINEFADAQKTEKMIYDRLLKTIPFFHLPKDQLKEKAATIARILNTEGTAYVTEEKQLGVLVIIDHSLELYCDAPNDDCLAIRQSPFTHQPIYIQANKVIANIAEARFQEAKELGEEANAVSTISNQQSSEVVSAYNKGWLFLSPTWEAPKSIYWGKTDWTKGIKLNREEYEAYFYGTQFLKMVQTPIRAGLLKEMFAPISSAEAKQHMNATSFEPIYAIPFILPIINDYREETYRHFQVLSQKYEDENISPTDLQLKIIGGLEKRIISNPKDEYRLTILYYSGELGRGNIHVRAMIEDVVPSVAMNVQKIIRKLNGRELALIADALSASNTNYLSFKLNHLPSLLSNAYGPGYLWTSLQAVLHREQIQLDRVIKQTARRLNELANKEDHWNLVNELLFYHGFRYFYSGYFQKILQQKEGCLTMTEWKGLLDRYIDEQLTEADLDTTEKIGFLSGCLLKQFERSYYAITNKKFVKTRVMRFGSKLTPEMIWKNGLLKLMELEQQREMGIKGNFYKALPLVLTSVNDLEQKQLLKKEKDQFMTMFWSGYLMMPSLKKGDEKNDHQ